VASPGDAVRVYERRYGVVDAVVAEWDFAVAGGSFGAHDGDVFVAACEQAARERTPLVSVTSSGGTRLTEGMHALVGIPRILLALDRLGTARVPHLAVATHPTTGGVWVAVATAADLRAGVRGATVGFSGPRIAAAMTGAKTAYSSTSAYDAGLLDAVIGADDVDSWLTTALAALTPDDPLPPDPVPSPEPPSRDGWEQVSASREADRPSGASLLVQLVAGAPSIPLQGRDRSVAATVGRIDGRRVVAVALAAERAGWAGPGGFALLRRAADLAGRLDLALVVLVDLAGADPATEHAGLAPAIAEAMAAVLRCPSPTVAVVHGAGGSGGALAGSVCDVVAVTELGWFAALGPEGAAAALRTSVEEASAAMAVTPRDLLGSGLADAICPSDALQPFLAATLDRLRALDPQVRMARRSDRWSAALPGSPGYAPDARDAPT
jgi:acetyl-CoA carboxylase carboxyl transferase subunit beta